MLCFFSEICWMCHIQLESNSVTYVKDVDMDEWKSREWKRNVAGLDDQNKTQHTQFIYTCVYVATATKKMWYIRWLEFSTRWSQNGAPWAFNIIIAITFAIISRDLYIQMDGTKSIISCCSCDLISWLAIPFGARHLLACSLMEASWCKSLNFDLILASLDLIALDLATRGWSGQIHEKTIIIYYQQMNEWKSTITSLKIIIVHRLWVYRSGDQWPRLNHRTDWKELLSSQQMNTLIALLAAVGCFVSMANGEFKQRDMTMLLEQQLITWFHWLTNRDQLTNGTRINHGHSIIPSAATTGTPEPKNTKQGVLANLTKRGASSVMAMAQETASQTDGN